MSTKFPGESSEYRAARDRLLDREVEMRRAVEALAAARRELPPGGAVPEDYAFELAGPDGAPAKVRMSELFAPGKDSLVIYSLMFGPERERPCAGCVSLLDPLEGAAEHVLQRVNLAVVAESPLPRIRTFAEERGWRHLPLLSAAGNSYNRDYHGKSEGGLDRPMLNVFHRDGETIRHFWGSELLDLPSEPGQESRAVDSIDTIWNVLDYTPEGRGTDWDPELSYS
jgi:predicted dithiol-disulfide oxidoreductase (DUF899 family)